MYQVKANRDTVLCEGCQSPIANLYTYLLTERKGKLLQDYVNKHMIIYEVECKECGEITHIQILKEDNKHE